MLNNNTAIIVLCTGNSCRSQIAEGYFKSILTERGLLRAASLLRSAGVETHGLNPRAVATMNEIGIDISTQESNNVSEYGGEQFDYAITLCDDAASRCPRFPATTEQLHWPFPDPAKAIGTEDIILEDFRRVRELIRIEIEQWIDKMLSEQKS